MSAELKISAKAGKVERYELLLQQAGHLFIAEDHWLSSLSNFTAVLKETFPVISWVGFYFMSGDRLVLGPFQGKIACTVIAPGKGVCGKVAVTGKTEIVENVHEFPGHIACDSGSNSEIVVPLIKNGKLIGVLDLDSYEFAAFDGTDKEYLEKLAAILLRVTTIPEL